MCVKLLGKTQRLFVAGLILATMVDISGAAVSTPDQARAEGLLWLYKNQHGDGGWGLVDDEADIFSTSAVLDAFVGFGINRGSSYVSALASLQNINPTSTDGLARQIISMSRAGSYVAAQSTALRTQALSVDGLWGPIPNYGVSVLDTSLASLALFAASAEVPMEAVNKLVCGALGPGQSSADKGWTHSLPAITTSGNLSTASILPTVYAIFSLAELSRRGYTSVQCSGGSVYNLKTMIAGGVSFLKLKRIAGIVGGYGENGSPTPFDTALVYKALLAANPSDVALADAQAYLLSTQALDGSWGQEPFQTAVVLQALAGPLVVSGVDGVPDIVKIISGMPSVSGNAPIFMKGNGRSVAGKTLPVAAFNAMLGIPTTYVLDGPIEQRTFVYELVAGILPPGFQGGISSNGIISGTPAAVGQFNILLKRTDSLGQYAYQDVQILVNALPSAVKISIGPNPTTKLTDTRLVAIVSGDRPVGRVEFYDGDTQIAAVEVAATSSAVTTTETRFSTLTKLSGGFRRIYAKYLGDSRHQSSQSDSISAVVNPEASSIIQMILN
jgi:hypothetical protein